MIRRSDDVEAVGSVRRPGSLRRLLRGGKVRSSGDGEPPRASVEDEEPAYQPIDWKLIRRLLRYLRPYRSRYALGIGLGVVMVVLEMQSPRFVGTILDYTTRYAGGALDPMPSQSAAITRVAAIVLGWGVVLGLALALQRYMILIMTDAGERVQFDLRRQIFSHLQHLSMSYYDRTRLGRIISRCTSDINSLREVNVWGIDTVIKNTMIICVAAGMLLSTDYRLFLSVAWLAPFIYVLNRVYRRKLGMCYQEIREGFTRVSSNLAENITGVRVVTAFNRQSWNLGAFNALQVTNTDNNMKAARTNGVYQPLLSVAGFCGRAIILLYGGYLISGGGDGALGVGSVVAAFLYWDWLMAPILNFGIFHNQLMAAMAGGERVFNLLDTRPDVSDVPQAYTLPAIRGNIVFEHVTFGYNPDRPVLHDIGFEAGEGRTVALVGPTGSGKSSILSLIARFYEPQRGRILVDGHDVSRITLDSLHRQIGLVLQANFLFTGTILENIRFARPEASDDEVRQAAKQLGTLGALESLPDGFNTFVGERGANISLGQRQLVCFTRAYLANPRIFMLDEATSAVDTATEQLIQSSLRTLCRGRTTIIVAHRLSTIQQADLILVIDAGRIIESGTHLSLLEQDGRYAKLYDQFLIGPG
jgi:ATP-binding cassette subfamily B protein